MNFDFAIPDRALSEQHQKRSEPDSEKPHQEIGAAGFAFTIPEDELPFWCIYEPPCQGTEVNGKVQHDWQCGYWWLPENIYKTPF